MTYELKDYLKSINKTKEKLMDTDDKMWEKKYPPFIGIEIFCFKSGTLGS